MGIVINGVKLDHGQATTVRVALNDMVLEMSNENALGQDDHGRAMAKAYRDRATEVLRIIHA